MVVAWPRDLEAQSRIRGGHGPTHHHVAVERRASTVRERHDEHVALCLGANTVRWRSGLPCAGKCVAHREREHHPWWWVTRSDRNAHACGIIDTPRCAQVARRDNGREPVLPAPVGQPGDRVIDDDLREHVGVRREVPDLLREQAGPLFLEQCGRAAIDQRLLERLAGRRPGPDLSGYGAIANPEPETCDGAVRGKRESVEHSKRLVMGIREVLLDDGPGDARARFGPERGPPERKLMTLAGHEPASAPGVRAGRSGGRDRHHSLLKASHRINDLRRRFVTALGALPARPAVSLLFRLASVSIPIEPPPVLSSE